MAYINIAEWTAEHVADWLAGLDDAIFPYAHFFINNNIDGRHLLTLLPDDLKHFNINKIGHQELILDGVDLLRQLHYTLTTETLQSLALRVGCKARSLYNDLKRNGPQEDNGKQQRVNVNTLASVSDILIAVKAFVSWLDRYPFDGERQYIPVRKTVLKLSIELASTAQRDQFADKPHETIKNSCLQLAELCDKVIQEFNDSLIIQPACLDIVTVKRKPDEDLGMHIHSSYSGIHTVGGVKFQSPAHRCGKVEIGDEIVQVNYQTVVGWQLKKLVSTMKEHPTELHLTLKKRPRHSNLLGQVIVMKPYRIPSRKTALARLHKWSESNSSPTPQDTFPKRRNAPLAIEEVEDDDDSAFLPMGVAVPGPIDKKLPTVHYPIFPAKSRATVQRRATVSGASPTVTRPPVSIEDLVAGVANLRKETVGRSISHDPSNRHNGTDNSRLVPTSKATSKETFLTVKTAQVDRKEGLTNGKEKEWPSASQEEESNILESKSLLASRITRQGARKNPPHSPLHKETTPPGGEKQPGSPAHTTNVRSPGLFPVNDQSRSPVLSKPTQGSETQRFPQRTNCVQLESSSENFIIKDEKSTTKEIYPVVPRNKDCNSPLKSRRRVSARELGLGDNQGWLCKRKEGKRLFSGPKWVKRWAVLKGAYLYFFRHKEDEKAECWVNLTGFVVNPAPDCKAKKYAFKLIGPNLSVLLATDNLTDMTIWMNKMGLVAISYSNLNKPRAIEIPGPEALYSETEDELDDTSRSDLSHSASPSPVSTCSSDSLFSSFLPTTRKPSLEFGPRGTLKTPNSFAQADPNDTQVSPRNPAGALKFSYPKPTKATSPQRTVAERPLERMVAENEARKSSLKTKMATTAKTKGIVGLWNPEPPPGPPPPAYEATIMSKFPQMIHKFPVPQSPTQHNVICSETSPTQPLTSLPYQAKQPYEPPPPLQPRGIKPNSGQSPVVPHSKPQVPRVYRSTGNIQRCTSLQKLTTSDTWNEKPGTPPAEAVSVLDREFHRLFGKKKPETISPQSVDDPRDSPDSTRSLSSWWTTSIPRTATSQQIHSLYTSQESWKSPSDQDIPSVPDRPPGTVRSMSVSSEMNLQMTLLEQVTNSRLSSTGSQSSMPKVSPKVSSSGYESGSPSVVPSISPCSSVDSNETSFSKSSKFSLAKQFSPKSPSGSFRFFSSPKFVRKFSSPRQERKFSQEQLKIAKNEESPKNSVSPKTERKFLGSPKLARAIFRSPKPSPKSVSTTTTGMQTEHTFDELVRLHQQNSNASLQNSPLSLHQKNSDVVSHQPNPNANIHQQNSNTSQQQIVSPHQQNVSPLQQQNSSTSHQQQTVSPHQQNVSKAQLHQQQNSNSGLQHSHSKESEKLKDPVGTINDKLLEVVEDRLKSSSNSSLNSNGSAVSSAGSSHYYVEARFRPQITISLPLVTESDDGGPRTPVKPTMGVSMIGKKRSPSTSSERAPSDSGRGVELEEPLQEEEPKVWAERSEITMIINTEEDARSVATSEDNASQSEESDDLGQLLLALRDLCLTPVGVDVRERRHHTMVEPSKNPRTTELVLALRAIQRTLADREREANAIDELLSEPITSQRLEEWICCYPHLLPPDYC